MGLPTSTANQPCFLCSIQKEDILNQDLDVTWKADADYNSDCANCELVVFIPDDETLRRVAFALQPNHKKKKAGL